MKHLPHLMTPAQCLLQALKSIQAQSLAARSQCQRISRRSFVDQRRISPTGPHVNADRLADFTRDEQIETPMVQVKNEEGRITDPQPLRRILQDLDRNSHCVVQLSKPGERDSAIVQIKAKMDLLKQLRDRENQIKQQEMAKREKRPKQIELNWAISDNDLNLKLKQIEGFLDKGKTVEILLAAKKRQRKASEDEGTSVLRRIRQTLQETGAKELKPMQGQVLRQATLVVRK